MEFLNPVKKCAECGQPLSPTEEITQGGKCFQCIMAATTHCLVCDQLLTEADRATGAARCAECRTDVQQAATAIEHPYPCPTCGDTTATRLDVTTHNTVGKKYLCTACENTMTVQEHPSFGHAWNHA